MDQQLIEEWFVFVAPTVIGFTLPRLVRRPLSLISIVIFITSLGGEGVHDDHFIAYLCNVMFLIGVAARECINLIVRTVRSLKLKHARD